MTTQKLNRITVKVHTTRVIPDGEEMIVRESTDSYHICASDRQDAINQVLAFHASKLRQQPRKDGEQVSYHCPEFSENSGSLWMRNPDVRFFGLCS